MDFELAEDHRMLKDLVANFVRDELMPLEAAVLEREAKGEGLKLSREETARIDAVSRELGLWGLDAPEDVGGRVHRPVHTIAAYDAADVEVVGLARLESTPFAQHSVDFVPGRIDFVLRAGGA